MNDLKKDMMRDVVQKITNQTSTLINSNTQNLKAQIDTQTQKSTQGMTALTQTLTTTMKSLIDTEVKKQVEGALRSKQWRDELVRIEITCYVMYLEGQPCLRMLIFTTSTPYVFD